MKDKIKYPKVVEIEATADDYINREAYGNNEFCMLSTMVKRHFGLEDLKRGSRIASQVSSSGNGFAIWSNGAYETGSTELVEYRLSVEDSDLIVWSYPSTDDPKPLKIRAVKLR